MWITRLDINPDERVEKRLMNEGDVHAFVYGLFPGETERRFLYRCDFRRGGHVTVLITSQTPPEPQGLHMETKEIPPSFFGSKAYRFRIRFAAVRRIQDPQSGKSKTLRIADEGRVMELLERTGDRNGVVFIPETMNVSRVAEMYIPHSRKDGIEGARIPFKSMDIEGVLVVKDEDLFRKAAEKGIGRWRSFGCGMLELQPIA